MPYVCGDYILAHARLHTNPSDWIEKSKSFDLLFLGSPCWETKVKTIEYCFYQVFSSKQGIRQAENKRRLMTMRQERLRSRNQHLHSKFAWRDAHFWRHKRKDTNFVRVFLVWLPLLGSNQRQPD